MYKTRHLIKTARTKDPQPRIRSLGKTPRKPYADLYTFKENDSANLLTKKKYKIAISTDLTTLRIRLIKCVFDTGAGLNLLHGDLVKPE